MSVQTFMRDEIKVNIAMKRARDADIWFNAFQDWYYARQMKEWVQIQQLRLMSNELQTKDTPHKTRSKEPGLEEDEMKLLYEEKRQRVEHDDVGHGPLAQMSTGFDSSKVYSTTRRLSLEQKRLKRGSLQWEKEEGEVSE
ncbi:hypothetical protein CC86DRAFT_401025 [Ophiobolus disseminans]|uniref:Uncharacterized protein n=1 Tax=Ophiobolus disseminans TaxID=1469910 RepID=A0A6A7AHS6_9PLEO|nr:hypothetical protein CC86DRAFT_401025 [Ophiobolus disseminans]